MKGSWGGGSQGELTLKASSVHADTKVKAFEKGREEKDTLHDCLREFFFHLWRGGSTTKYRARRILFFLAGLPWWPCNQCRPRPTHGQLHGLVEFAFISIRHLFSLLLDWWIVGEECRVGFIFSPSSYFYVFPSTRLPSRLKMMTRKRPDPFSLTNGPFTSVVAIRWRMLLLPSTDSPTWERYVVYYTHERAGILS